jgi:hypothetical protein
MEIPIEVRLSHHIPMGFPMAPGTRPGPLRRRGLPSPLAAPGSGAFDLRDGGRRAGDLRPDGGAAPGRRSMGWVKATQTMGI